MVRSRGAGSRDRDLARLLRRKEPTVARGTRRRTIAHLATRLRADLRVAPRLQPEALRADVLLRAALDLKVTSRMLAERMDGCCGRSRRNAHS